MLAVENIQLVPVIVHILGEAELVLVRQHINMLVQEQATLVVRVRRAMENINLVIAQVAIAGMVRHANTAVALINTPAQVVIYLEVLAHLVVENIQLVLVIVHIFGQAGPALAQVHINILAQEWATLAARVLLAAENINLVIVIAHIRGRMVLVLVRQHINMLVQEQATLVVRVRRAMENINLVLVQVGMSGRMGCVSRR